MAAVTDANALAMSLEQLGYVSATMPCIEYWDKVLAFAVDLFESRVALYRCIACIRAALPQVTEAIAYCAIAESCGQVSDAIEKLHDPSYEREVAYVCTVIDVAKMLTRLRFDGKGSPRASGETHLKAFAGSPPDSPVRFPTIGGAAPHLSDGGTLASGASSDTASSSPRVVLPLFQAAPHLDTSAKAALSTVKHQSTASVEQSRIGDMVNAHFHKHQHEHSSDGTALSSPLAHASPRKAGGVTLHSLAGESVAVVHDFRHVHSALLHSQQPFGSTR